MINKELEEKVKLIKEKSPKDLTYSDRYYLWEYNRLTNSSNKWDEGEEVKIYDGPTLASNKLKNGFGDDFPERFREWGNHFGKKVLNKADNKIYTLIGMSYTYLDYYYILESEDGKKHYSSCIGKLIVI